MVYCMHYVSACLDCVRARACMSACKRVKQQASCSVHCVSMKYTVSLGGGGAEAHIELVPFRGLHINSLRLGTIYKDIYNID